MGIRTPDLLIANETLYQLSYTPVRIKLSQVGFDSSLGGGQIFRVTVSLTKPRDIDRVKSSLSLASWSSW